MKKIALGVLTTLIVVMTASCSMTEKIAYDKNGRQKPKCNRYQYMNVGHKFWAKHWFYIGPDGKRCDDCVI